MRWPKLGSVSLNMRGPQIATATARLCGFGEAIKGVIAGWKHPEGGYSFFGQVTVYGAMHIIGLAGWSGAGKTTLLAKIIPLLVARGYTVSTVKHAHHNFDVDTPGKDSHVHRMAGATEVLVASGRRWALMHELRNEPEPSICDLLTKMSPVDLVLVEGFKAARHPRIEVYRQEVGKPPLYRDNPQITGVVSDVPLPDAGRPVVPINDVEGVIELMLANAERLETMLARMRELAVGES
jgi:molybdopterin-guanine dinucleotide biosynthesis adapter protein